MLQQQRHQYSTIGCVLGKLRIWPRMIEEDFREPIRAGIIRYGRYVADAVMLELEELGAAAIRQRLPLAVRARMRPS